MISDQAVSLARSRLLPARPLLIVLVVIAGLALGLTGARAQTVDPAFLETLEALNREIQTCGMNVACIERVQRKLQELSKSMQPPMGPPSTPPASQAQMERSQAQSDAVHAALTSKAEDPCYAVHYTKEMARRVRGSDLPWMTCSPLEITVRWEITERIPLEKFEGRYVVEQRYPGYLQIERDERNRRDVVSYRIGSPAPQGKAEPENRIVSASAVIMGVRYGGILAPRAYDEKPFTTNRTDDFSVKPGHGAMAFSYSRPAAAQSRVTDHHLRLAGPKVSVDIERRDGKVGHSFHQPLVDHYAAASITTDELERGLKTGEASKTFPIAFSLGPVEQRGKVTVTVVFDHAPGRLVVSPAGGLAATGPDCAGAFAPAATQYTLSNPGDSPIALRLEGGASWLGTGFTSATLGPGQRRKLDIGIDAKSVPSQPGEYAVKLSFRNTTNGRGNTQRTVSLRVRETQEWRTRLSGFYERSVRWTREILQAGASKTKMIKDVHTYRFDYALTGEFMLEKRKGQWRYTCGTVKSASVKPHYTQTPAGLWNVSSKICKGCASVAALNGQSLSGAVYGTDVQLLWPVVKPALEITAQIALKCLPNPKVPGSCSVSSKGGTARYEDAVYLSTARDHLLPLANTIFRPTKPKKSQFSKPVVTQYTYKIQKIR